ncbi:MAG TPA: radical SAM protein [Myxococcota bacterium]|nr:radical SAM protein [Myxococcota bacterium]
MRVQFIWFNLNSTPKMNIGVALLARELTEAGHEVSVLHLNEHVGMAFDPKNILSRIRFFDPGLIALSFGRNHLRHVEALVPLLKKELPDVPILCGGVHPTLFPEQVIALDEIDYICIGEADGLLADFVTGLEAGRDVSKLSGFWGKRAGSIWRNPMAPLPDIREQTWIDLDHIDYGPSLAYNRGMFEVITGRGCPNSCSFCFNQTLRDTYRRRVPAGEKGMPHCRKRGCENLFGEMEMIREHFGQQVKMFSLADDAINFDRQWMLDFCRGYSERFDLPYTCNLLVDGIDDELAAALSRSGAIAKVGVESGCERIRSMILGKPFDQATIERALARLKTHNVPTRIYLMVGNPTETRDEMLTTFRFAAKLRATSTRLCIFYPVEGTPIHELCVRDSLLSGREYENYDDLSVLRWDSEMALFIEKAHLLHPWMQNVYLSESCAREYGPLLGQALAMPQGEWDSTQTRDWIRSSSIALTIKLRTAGIEHYFNPFPERSDVTFLYGGDPVGLPNADLEPGAP